MREGFTQRDLQEIKRFIKKGKYQVYRLKISFGRAENKNLSEEIERLNQVWKCLTIKSPINFFLNVFCGLIKELIFDIDENGTEPFIQVLCIRKAEPQQFDFENEKILKKRIEAYALLILDGIQTEFLSKPVYVKKIPSEKIEKIIGELMLPIVRAKINADKEKIQMIKDNYEYNKRNCSRYGYLSKSSLSRNVTIQR